MISIRNQAYIFSVTSLISGSIMIAFGANTAPSAQSTTPVFIMLLLLYITSLNVVALLTILATGKSWTKYATHIFLIACVPAAFVMVASMRQASILDFVLLLITVTVIIWYATYNKR